MIDFWERRLGRAHAVAKMMAKRASLLLMGLWLGAQPALAQDTATAVLTPPDRLAMAAAFAAADVGLWDEARLAARVIGDPLMRSVFAWADFVGGDPEGHRFEAISTLALTYRDWPNRAALIRAGEAALARALDQGEGVPQAADIARFFDVEAPHTFDGVMAYAAALTTLGRDEVRTALLQDRWVDSPLTEAQEEMFLRRYGQDLGPTAHAERLDALLWAGRWDEADRQLARVGADQRRLGEARLRLQRRQDGVDAAIDAVPAVLRDDEGLSYDRLRWRWRAGLVDGAMALLDEQPANAVHRRAWWNQRDVIARALHRAGRYADAYAVARDHGYERGVPFAVGEWFAGWMALRFLNDPQTALQHFTTLYEGVGTPISLGRGAYWAGRAATELGDRDQAAAWFSRAAVHGQTFYGQLAADALARPSVSTVPSGLAEITGDDIAVFEADPRVRIARVLASLGQDALAGDFLIRLSVDGDGPAHGFLASRLAFDLGRPDLGLMNGRLVLGNDDILLTDAAYPLITTPTADSAVEPALIHALIRRESGFRTDAVSPAGALGLMQLMPGTADLVANRLSIDHQTAALTVDAALNVRLGSAYLADRIERYDGAYALALAAYNAGAGRVDEWLERFGNPSGRGVEAMVDWIETIPFSETRSYVQRVLEDLQVYRLRFGGQALLASLTEDLTR